MAGPLPVGDPLAQCAAELAGNGFAVNQAGGHGGRHLSTGRQIDAVASGPYDRGPDQWPVAPARSLYCRCRDEFGAWRSLVAHLLWEQRVGGSNPSAPTTRPLGKIAGPTPGEAERL